VYIGEICCQQSAQNVMQDIREIVFCQMFNVIHVMIITG
jgi:hypothetical protein